MRVVTSPRPVRKQGGAPWRDNPKRRRGPKPRSIPRPRPLPKPGTRG